MKRFLAFVLLLALPLSALAQAGLSEGQAVVSPSATPSNSTRKHCPHCGITQGNVTYPWQHETWCPYYRSQSSGGGSSSSSVSSSVTAAAIGTGTFLKKDKEGLSVFNLEGERLYNDVKDFEFKDQPSLYIQLEDGSWHHLDPETGDMVD